MTVQLPCGHFYGETLVQRACAGLVVTETRYPPEAVVPAHSHDRAYYCLVLGGAYTECYGTKTRLCRPPSLLFHPSREVHSELFHRSGGRCVNVELDQSWLGRALGRPPRPGEEAEFRSGALKSLGMRLYNELHRADPAALLAIEGLVLEILAETSRAYARTARGAPPPWLTAARQSLHDSFSRRLDLDAIARSAGVHPTHLAREFRRHYGCSPGAYLRRLRIDFACGRLAHSESAFAEVALAAGFYDQSHFTKTFRHFTGMTPSRYRALFRGR
jgi:AraC family transcriptional regulator